MFKPVKFVSNYHFYQLCSAHIFHGPFLHWLSDLTIRFYQILKKHPAATIYSLIKPT